MCRAKHARTCLTSRRFHFLRDAGVKGKKSHLAQITRIICFGGKACRRRSSRQTHAKPGRKGQKAVVSHTLLFQPTAQTRTHPKVIKRVDLNLQWWAYELPLPALARGAIIY